MRDINLLIVEDEDLIREHFIHSFPASQHHYTIVADASNGIEALDYCKQYPIDIVITDIVMPLMDGIELTKELKRLYPHIKVVLLSCHEEFTFAQQAISLGASDYLLKASCSFTDLLNVLKRLTNEITQEKSDQPLAPIQGKLMTIHQHRMSLLAQIIDANSQKLPVNLFIDEFGIVDRYANFCIMQLRIKGYHYISESPDLNHSITLRNDLIDSIESLSFSPSKCYVFSWTENRVGLLLANSNVAIGFNEDELIDIAGQIQSMLKLKFNIITIAGISNVYATFNHNSYIKTLARQMFESSLCIDKFFYKTNKRIISMDKDAITTYMPLKSYIREQLDTKFYDAYNTPVFNDMLLKIQSLAASIIHFNLKPDAVAKWLLILTNELHPIPLQSKENPIISIKYIESIHDVEVYLQSLILKKKQLIHIDQQSSDNPYVQQTLDYLHNHYNEKILVKDISDTLFLSANYLSHVFKKETGIGIINYLNNIRIEYAAHFLTNSQLSASEIANNVGIYDYKYFIKLFSSTKNMTPGEFRKNHGNKNE